MLTYIVDTFPLVSYDIDKEFKIKFTEISYKELKDLIHSSEIYTISSMAYYLKKNFGIHIPVSCDNIRRVTKDDLVVVVDKHKDTYWKALYE